MSFFIVFVAQSREKDNLDASTSCEAYLLDCAFDNKIANNAAVYFATIDDARP